MTEVNRVEKPWGKGRLVHYFDSVADDSDKSYTVPTGKIWEFVYLGATIVCSATVGNRSLRMTISDGTNLIYKTLYQASVAASQTGTFFVEPGAFANSTTARPGPGASDNANVTLTTSVPSGLRLLAGYVIRVWDRNAIDAAADDMTVALGYIEYDA